MQPASNAAKYTLTEHRHRFAVWAAARAAQRGWTSTERLAAALEASGASALVRGSPTNWPATAGAFDAAQREWAHALLDHLAASGVHGTYGRAAKLLAIYLKATIVLAGHADSPFGRVLHPPLDSILLRNLAADTRFPAARRSLWRQTSWTRLDEQRYFELIDTLRATRLDQPAFWMVERYWQP